MAKASPFLLVLGFLVLVHGAISMKQFQQYLKTADEPSSIPTPIDIIAEVFVGIFICILAVSVSTSELKGIFAAPEHAQKSYDSLTPRDEFMNFNHRSRALALLRKQACAK
eukprot:TRINITY_DN2237_c0_g1_i2.p1 TRINITY_DN2237_c0_g1~~TRINITY_DN2237_c0_g1_i2.p1  ORF type:complete len:111 (-),score=15.35 TRINITY_DN2237_c0_g1_i2:279-611(-)